VRLDTGENIECVLKGRSTTLACGDRVQVARVAGGGSIESVLPRTTLFYRSDEFREKLIAANVTQVIGVVAPDLGVDEELVNRWIIGAEAQRCRFVLAANKSDKPDFSALLARVKPFATLGYTVVPMSAQRDVAPLLPFLARSSHRADRPVGMGKSTILNAVAPHAFAKTATSPRRCSRAATRRRNPRCILLPADKGAAGSSTRRTQGVRPRARRPEAIDDAFVEIRPLLGHCRFRDCRHDRERACAVQAGGRVFRHASPPFRVRAACRRWSTRSSAGSATARPAGARA
jgi:ribosome biogenesis GTPase